VADSTLDQELVNLRQAVDREIARARREAIVGLNLAVSKMRGAANETEWRTAVDQAQHNFGDDPDARELLSAVASLTAPAPAENPKEASARRFAKVRIAEMQLYHAPAVKAGRAARDLYGALQPQFDAARQAFAQKYLSNGTRTADYLHSEFVRALAHDDTTLLGPGYPGPLA
jgi:hypothetical protein